MSFHLFEVRIDELATPEKLIERLYIMLDEPRSHTIVTPNPEILLLARTDPAFVITLNQAELSLPDGIGISFISLLKHGRWLKRYTGIDTAEILLSFAEKQDLTVLLLGGKRASASHATKNLRERFSKIRVFAAGEDVCFQNNGASCEKESDSRIAETIERYAPDIILVGLGAPKQENWIERHHNDLPSVRIMMAVGGAFDVWSGSLHRAPSIFRAAGLEWFWRLVQEPKRLPRILRATVLFPWYALKDRR